MKFSPIIPRVIALVNLEQNFPYQASPVKRPDIGVIKFMTMI